MKTIQEIKDELSLIARRLLLEAGYSVDENDVKLELTVAGHHMKYDGWSYSLGEKEWDQILSLDWEESQNELLKSIKDGQNQPIPIPRPHKREVNKVEVINKTFKAEELPYLLAQVVPPGSGSVDPTYRIFIRP